MVHAADGSGCSTQERRLLANCFGTYLPLALLSFGLIFGGYHWYVSAQLERATPAGTIMLSVVPIILGVQLLLAAISLDVANVPSTPLQDSLEAPRARWVRIPEQKVAND